MPVHVHDAVDELYSHHPAVIADNDMEGKVNYFIFFMRRPIFLFSIEIPEILWSSAIQK